MSFLFLLRYTRIPSQLQLIRSYSSKKSPQFALTDDGSTFVVWHPMEDFPYEATRPIPEVQLDDSSVLKTQISDDLLSVFNKKTPDQARAELMNITHTTKHRWYPRARDKKRKRTTMDREYL